MPTNRELARRSAPRPDLDEVNDALFDSFPASDPPAWSSMHAGPPRLSEPPLAAKPLAPP